MSETRRVSRQINCLQAQKILQQDLHQKRCSADVRETSQDLKGGKADLVHPDGLLWVIWIHPHLIYMKKDDLKEAFPYYEKAIAIYRLTLSPIHPDRIRMKQNNR